MILSSKIKSAFDIGGRVIGPGHPCFIIAEAGVNHDGDPDTAMRLVDVAADAGADAVKFQSFSADTLSTEDAPKAAYQKRTTNSAESQRAMLRRLQLTEGAHRAIQTHCRARGIMFLSSPFDEANADLLATLEVPAFKIPSGEITNSALLARIAGHGLPAILSTGMSTLDEVATAIQILTDGGTPGIVLLHCVSNYPAKAADCNLRAMATMAEKFSLPVGYSDHTLGDEIALAAVAMGACVIEKHVTLDCTRSGPDHAASMEPDNFALMIERLRRIESAFGDGIKRRAPSEAAIAAIARKSLVAAADIRAGTTITDEMIAARRPGTGIAPGERYRILGRIAARDIARDTVISFDMLA